MKKLFSLILALRTVSMFTVFASAATYKYEVKVYAGNMGTFKENGTPELSYTIEVEPDSGDITLAAKTTDEMNLTDSNYFVKGFKKAGQDEVLATAKITGDAEYVMVYGIKGDQVGYTVQYLEKGTNKELLPEAHYMGNKNEMAVVAYRFVDGYVPQAYNLEKTLSEVEEDNVFTFYYSKPRDNEITNIINQGVTVVGGRGTGSGGTE